MFCWCPHGLLLDTLVSSNSLETYCAGKLTTPKLLLPVGVSETLHWPGKALGVLKLITLLLSLKMLFMYIVGIKDSSLIYVRGLLLCAVPF